MAKVGQFKIGAALCGVRFSTKTAAGNFKFYDKRCRRRIILGAEVRGHIANNSIWRIRKGNGHYGSVLGKKYQEHFKYYKNIGAPGSDLADWQTVFAECMAAAKVLTEEQKAPYKAMATDYYNKRRNYIGTYKCRSWIHFFASEWLKAYV